MPAPRRWEFPVGPLLARLGIERPDQTPAQVDESLYGEFVALDARHAAPHPGTRVLALRAQVAAVVGEQSVISITPPEAGCYLLSIIAQQQLQLWTENQQTTPALNAAAFSLTVEARPDNNEPAPVFAATGGSFAGAPAGVTLPGAAAGSQKIWPDPCFWRGTALVMRGLTATAVDATLLVAVPLVGMRR